MQAPPIIAASKGPIIRQGDAFFRAGTSVCLGILGFWFPLWYDHRLDSADSRLGIVLLWTIPVIAVFAARATSALLATSPGSSFRGCVHSPIRAVLLLLCWSPFLFLAYLILGVCFTFASGLLRTL
jgi:hypothetical protein